MDKVSLLKCESYDLDLVESKIRKGFELLGGDEYIRKLIPNNSRVLLKPNLLKSSEKGGCTTTHYVTFEAVIRILKDYSNNISFGDSPGFGDGYKIAQKVGLVDVAQKYGVKYAPFKEEVHVQFKEGLICKSWDIAKDVIESDVLITLPRIKTHGMASYTGAIKNQFGCVVGIKKAQWHTRTSKEEDFCKMLLDLNSVVKTKFAILDGIVAMEGNGPASGTPYNLQTLIMGESLSSVDAMAVKIIGYDKPTDIITLRMVNETGWGNVDINNIEILGDKIENHIVKDFKLILKSKGVVFGNETINNIMRRIFTPNPVITYDKCISCKRCKEVCPTDPKSIEMKDKKGKIIPRWDRNKCIRCFCCQELCPVGAIEPSNNIFTKNRP